MTDNPDLTPFKQDDLGDGKCDVCGRLLTEGGIYFFRTSVEQFIFDPRACQRALGFELMVGHPAIARAMGRDEPLAHGMGKTERLVCAEHLEEISHFWGE